VACGACRPGIWVRKREACVPVPPCVTCLVHGHDLAGVIEPVGLWAQDLDLRAGGAEEGA